MSTRAKLATAVGVMFNIALSLTPGVPWEVTVIAWVVFVFVAGWYGSHYLFGEDTEIGPKYSARQIVAAEQVVSPTGKPVTRWVDLDGAGRLVLLFPQGTAGAVLVLTKAAPAFTDHLIPGETYTSGGARVKVGEGMTPSAAC